MKYKLAVLDFEFPRPPVPASRPRVTRTGHAFTDPKYAAYKKALTAALYDRFGYFCWDFPPPGSKERSKWLKNNRYKLVLNVYQDTNRGDIDNFAKTAMDALTQAGVIADDVQIDQVEASKQV